LDLDLKNFSAQNGNFIIRMGTSLDNGYSYPTPIYYCDFFLYPVAFLYYMTFLPLIVVGVYLIYNSKKPRINEWIYLALGMSGIILSHVLTCEIVVVNLIILCIVLLKRTLKKERIMAFIKAAIMCLVLTIWYLLPFIDYFVSQETIVQAGDLRLLDNSSQEIIDIFQLFAPGNEGWKCITLGAALILSLGITLYCLYKYSSKEGNEKAIFCIKIFSAFGIVNTLFICKFFPWGSIQQILGIDGLGYQVGSIQFSWRFDFRLS